ncbi:MAG: hypothetical protein JW807_08095 [Spirochaetes bacterium]|nr:hypothetical protein [Spirochaetota bacterium]
MNKRLKIASLLFYAVCAAGMCIGAVYLLTQKMLPYHEKFLGITQEQVSARWLQLLFASYRIMGSLIIALGIASIMLIKQPLMKGENWARWAVMIILLIPQLTVLFMMLHNGMYGLCLIIGLLIALVFMAFYLSKATRVIEQKL